MSENNYKEDNIKAIVNYFKSGEKEDLKPKLGIEIEHHIVDKDTGTPITYRSNDKKIGVQEVLEKLSQFYPEKGFEDGEILSLTADDANITLEPANQLEISIAPYENIDDIRKAYERFRSHVEPILENSNFELVNAGYNPTTKALDMELIPKKRYAMMDRYFKELGTNGHYMMRGSGSTQVSIDYKNEEDALLKLRIATVLAPIFAAMADNTKVFEGEPYDGRVRRLELWREVDAKRCQVVPGLFEPNFSFEEYARKLYNVPPIFVNEEIDGKSIPKWTGDSVASELYKDKRMNEKEIEHLISLTWPDVRLKKFVEIRPADSLPEELALGYASLIKGLLYPEETLLELKKLLGAENDDWKYSEDLIEEVIDKIQTEGLKADIYGTKLSDWINTLTELASKNLNEEEQGYLKKFRDFAFNKSWIKN